MPAIGMSDFGRLAQVRWRLECGMQGNFALRAISGEWLSSGILPPERMPERMNEVIAWLKAAGSDDSRLIVLQKQ